jgi:hypothetical protein
MEKLLTIISLGQRAYGRWVFRRILSGAFMVAILSLVMAAMISALLVACLYALYAVLLSYGFSIVAAALLTAGAAMAVIAGLAWGMYALLRSLRHMHRTLFSRSQMSGQVMDVVDAFMGGLMDDSRPRGTTHH